MTEIATGRDHAILAGITILAAALRLYGLDASLWYDEVLTLVEFVRLPPSGIVSSYTSLNNHVLYSLLAHVSVGWLGEAAWTLRLPAAIMGIAAIPALWMLGRSMRLPVAWCHVAALLLALSYHHIWFSQNARGYTGLVLLSLLMIQAMVTADRTGRRAPWIWMGVAGGLALYLHLSAAFFLTALGVVWIGALIRRAATGGGRGLATLAPVAGFGLAAALGLALHAPMLDQMVATFTEVRPDATPDRMAEWRNPLWTLYAIVESVPGPMAAKLVLLPPVLAVVALGVAAVHRRAPLVNWIALAHLAVTLGVLSALSFRIWPRYFLTELAFLSFYASAGLFRIGDLVAGLAGRGGGTARALGGIGVIVAVVVSAGLASRNYAAPKQDFEGAVRHVAEHRTASDPAASLGLISLPISRYFAPDWAVIEDPDTLKAQRADGGRLWVVTGFPVHTRRSHPDMMRLLETDFDRVITLPGTLANGTLTLYRERER